MVGGEHRKERFSERLEDAQNQPKNRCYLPGTGIVSEGYTPTTLQGNWYEERADAAFYDGRPVLVNNNTQKVWTTTYREMVKEPVGPAGPSFNQGTMNEIVDRMKSRYPTHQPHLDPKQEETAGTAYVSVSMNTYVPPEVSKAAEREHVAPMLGRNPGSQATGVLMRLRRQLELTMPQKSAFPGNVARAVRLALRNRCSDRSGFINVPELQAGLTDAGIAVSPPECVALVRWFDKTGNGTASVDAMVRELRGPLNDRREQVVRNVYAMLEKTCTGNSIVTVGYMADLVDVEQLADVMSGSVSAEEARAAFVEQWDARDSSKFISYDVFMTYFGDASFEEGIDNVFELMLRNIWHLSGGNGKSMNTSCRRVEVLHLNGRVTREEIKNDLTLRIADDAHKYMLDNLAHQGIKDVKRLTVLDEWTD